MQSFETILTDAREQCEAALDLAAVEQLRHPGRVAANARQTTALGVGWPGAAQQQRRAQKQG